MLKRPHERTVDTKIGSTIQEHSRVDGVQKQHNRKHKRFGHSCLNKPKQLCHQRLAATQEAAGALYRPPPPPPPVLSAPAPGSWAMRCMLRRISVANSFKQAARTVCWHLAGTAVTGPAGHCRVAL